MGSHSPENDVQRNKNFGYKKKMVWLLGVVIMRMLCAFVFRIYKWRFSHDRADNLYIKLVNINLLR